MVQVQATDKDIGRNAKLKYSIYNDIDMDKLDEIFEIDSGSGMIVLKKNLENEHENQVYQFFVRAQDKGKLIWKEIGVILFVKRNFIHDTAETKRYHIWPA